LCKSAGRSASRGDRHDLFNIQELFKELCHMLTKADINMKGLFMNADSGFDSIELGQICKDKEIESNIDINTCNSKIHEN
jgi:hypothetical protein